MKDIINTEGGDNDGDEPDKNETSPLKRVLTQSAIDYINFLTPPTIPKKVTEELKEIAEENDIEVTSKTSVKKIVKEFLAIIKESIPEPTAPVTPLTKEAEELLNNVEDSTGIEIIDNNIKRIALENNIEITEATTPEDFVKALQLKKEESTPLDQKEEKMTNSELFEEARELLNSSNEEEISPRVQEITTAALKGEGNIEGQDQIKEPKARLIVEGAFALIISGLKKFQSQGEHHNLEIIAALAAVLIAWLAGIILTRKEHEKDGEVHPNPIQGGLGQWMANKKARKDEALGESKRANGSSQEAHRISKEAGGIANPNLEKSTIDYANRAFKEAESGNHNAAYNLHYNAKKGHILIAEAHEKIARELTNPESIKENMDAASANKEASEAHSGAMNAHNKTSVIHIKEQINEAEKVEEAKKRKEKVENLLNAMPANKTISPPNEGMDIA